MIRNIIVPLDGSKFGELCLPLAVRIASESAAQLHLVHVLVPLVVGDPMMQYTMLDTETPLEGRQYLADLLARLPGPKLNHAPKTMVLEGPVTDAIGGYCDRNAADLVVMNTHGRGPFARAWMGSVADELIRRSKAPVLLARTPDAESTETTRAIHRALIAVDGSPESERMLGPAAEIARLFRASVIVMRVTRPKPQEAESRSSIAPNVHEIPLNPIDGESPGQELSRLAKALRDRGVSAETLIVEHHRPEEAILQHAHERGVDLIALETHGRSGLARLLLGSVSDKVARGSECPVLIHCRKDSASTATTVDDDDDELVIAHKSPDPVSAEVIVADLKSEGISAASSGAHQAGFAGVPAVGVEILVRRRDLERSRKIIERHGSRK